MSNFSYLKQYPYFGEVMRVCEAAMTASLSELEDTFNALMQRAFKGELA